MRGGNFYDEKLDITKRFYNLKWDEKNTETEKYDQVSEYFQCISECDIPDHDIKRFCEHILTTN